MTAQLSSAKARIEKKFEGEQQQRENQAFRDRFGQITELLDKHVPDGAKAKIAELITAQAQQDRRGKSTSLPRKNSKQRLSFVNALNDFM